MLAHGKRPTHAAPFVQALWVALLCGCSTMPGGSFPAFTDHHVAADFVVPPEGRLHLPATTRDLVVRELELEPAPVREAFAPGDRWFEYPAGTAVRMRCRLRAYALPDGSIPSLRAILPDAAAIHTLTSP